MPQKQKNTAGDTVTIPRKEYEELKFKQVRLEQQLAELKRIIYGSKSERFVPTKDSNQLELGMEAEEEPAAKEQPKEKITYEREKPAGKKKKAVRAPIPDHLSRRSETINPEVLPEGSKKIGEEITEILEYEPGSFYVRQIIRPKYALPKQEGVAIAELPSLPIPRGNAGSTLLAYIAICKFVDHLPFFRIRKIFKRNGLEIPESTIGGWFAATCKLLGPLYEKLTEEVLAQPYIQADETPIPVLTSKKPGSTHKGYHWVYHAPQRKLVLFDYRKSRAREGPEEMLEAFLGALQTDGYAGYNAFARNPDITLLACMAHARRKFKKAQDNDRPRAEYALGKIQQLYRIERQAREAGMDAAQRLALRQKEAVPVLEELEAWLKATLNDKGVLPKSTIGEAIQYTLSLWPRLKRYAEDGRWEIDNNLIENTIRPVALGRKNYLFAGSHKAARNAAMIYSFLGSCKLNDVDPLVWLTDVLDRLPDHTVNRLEELLPNNWKPGGNN